MNRHNLKTLLAALTVSILAAACGGGGGNDNSATLSADQKAYEQFMLAPGASYAVSWELPLSGAPVNGSNYLLESHASMAASPSSASPQVVRDSTPTSLAHSLNVPADFSVTRYLINGAIVTGSESESSISYQGTGIKIDRPSSDGSRVVESTLISNVEEVPLSGAVVAAPADFAHWFNALYYNSSLLNTSATWNAGSDYLTFTDTEAADIYTVVDYAVATAGTVPSPVASGTTIAALMAAGGIVSKTDGVIYTLNNGSVSTINGVTTYVSTAFRPNLTTPVYRTFYDLDGNVYMGDFVKAGTILGGSAYPVAAPGTSSGYTVNDSQQFQIRLNAAAIASLSAAVTF